MVVCPAKNGKAPQTPQPIAPKKKSFLNSFLIIFEFFIKKENVNGKSNKTTTVHLQNANEIGGTYSTPPLATIKLDAMKIGWINKSEKANKFFFLSDNFFLLVIIFYQRKLRTAS